ncbi:hypothetical protein Bbelb_273460, partial [Branchiostoma belcheri]
MDLTLAVLSHTSSSCEFRALEQQKSRQRDDAESTFPEPGRISGRWAPIDTSTRKTIHLRSVL